MSHDRYFVNRVADHLLALEPERFRVIEGNYDSYQDLLHRGDESSTESSGPMAAARASGKAKSETKASSPASSGGPNADKSSATTKVSKKRRFPFRKVADLEEEIFSRETRMHELQCQMSEPAIVRDGERMRQIKIELEEEQEKVKTLYAHWEEATELNW